LSIHTTPQFTAYRFCFEYPLTSCALRRCRRFTALYDVEQDSEAVPSVCTACYRAPAVLSTLVLRAVFIVF